MTRAFFMRPPRLMLSAAAVTVCMLTICVLVAYAMSRTGAFSMLTAFLALAPGGAAEMAILATTFGIGAPIVTAFHFFRVISAVLLGGWIVRLTLRSGWVQRQAPSPA